MSSRARRPRIAIPGRFSTTASALRFEGVVVSRLISDAVWRAGAEPLMLYPSATDGTVDEAEIAARLAIADGVLVPGGGDVAPAAYGETVVSDKVDGVEVDHDAFDLAVTRIAWRERIPLLAICRGLQVANVAAGGTLIQHLGEPFADHQALEHEVSWVPGSRGAAIVDGRPTKTRCSHHQAVKDLGEGLVVTARAADGTAEALEFAEPAGWFVAVQFHPEDTSETDPVQRAFFDAFVHAARLRIALQELLDHDLGAEHGVHVASVLAFYLVAVP